MLPYEQCKCYVFYGRDLWIERNLILEACHSKFLTQGLLY